VKVPLNTSQPIRTSIVEHDEARFVTYDQHRLRRQRVEDLNEVTTSDHLATGRLTIRRLPRHCRTQLGGNHAHYVPGKVHKKEKCTVCL